MCVCFVLSFSPCRFSSVVVARRCCLSFGRGCLSFSFVVVVGRCCLSWSFVVVVLPLSLSSWSVRPCLVFVSGRCRLRGPWTLVCTYDLPSLERLSKMPLGRCMCPRGTFVAFCSCCQDQRCLMGRSMCPSGTVDACGQNRAPFFKSDLSISCSL